MCPRRRLLARQDRGHCSAWTGQNIILETVKPAEDGSQGVIVLRLYEAMGTRTRV
jgi:alpha-mannosidase